MKNLNGEDKEDNLDLRGLRATIFCCNTASDTTVNQLRKKQIITFTGADHLQHHFSSATSVQPRLLIKDLLLFHLLLLRDEHTHTVMRKATF